MAQQDINTSALDPELLSSPFRIHTNWHVITGAACTGKTTLIDMLAEKGFKTVPESGRLYINQELAAGRTIEEIFSDPSTEAAIDDIQLKAERSLRAAEVIFLDRGLPDSLTFRRLHGMDPNEFLPQCFYHRYASVFVLDRLPLQLDGARIDDEDYACFLDDWLARDYSALGYDVVRVAVLPPEERMAYVIEIVSRLGRLSSAN